MHSIMYKQYSQQATHCHLSIYSGSHRTHTPIPMNITNLQQITYVSTSVMTRPSHTLYIHTRPTYTEKQECP